jgi:acylphosphatase
MAAALRHVSIRGRVQGVGYRAWVEQEASARRLEGWVRNRRDSGVEALFAGPDDVVADMIARCHRGPSFARVDAVDEKPGTSDELALRHKGERFSVLPTL